MPDPITWEQWQDKAKKAYKKGVYTKKEMVRDWGFPSDLDPEKDYILFDKGKPYIQDYQKRLERKRNSSKTRSARNVTSTNLANHLNKVQSKEQRRILDEASMFALDDPELSMMVEHGVPVSQYHQILEEGAPDDPSNKYIQRTVDGIAKTDAEKLLSDRGLDKQFTIIDHEDFGQPPRLVPLDSYNPHEFPSKQGVPFASLDDLKLSLKKVAKATPFIGVTLAAITAADQAMAGDLTAAGGTLVDEAVSEIGLEVSPTANGDMSYPAYIKQKRQQEQERIQRSEEAKSWNGHWGVNLGDLRLSLPDYGLTELNGFN